MEATVLEIKMANEQKTLADIIKNYQENTAPNLVKITDPEELIKYGWSEPFPSYVTASQKLWDQWLKKAQATRDK